MIALREVTVRAGSFFLEGISFEIPAGAYGVLMGRTGSGKTTILETVCGLKQVQAGAILLGGREVTRVRAAERNIGFVPQDGALFQTMTVYENMAFALRVRRWARERVEGRVRELAELLGVGRLLDRETRGLSGGEKQRVALGRALSFSPPVLCLDEPLSALDDDTREEMMALLKEVQRQTGVTALHITHNRLEAQRLADVLLKIDGALLRMTPSS